MLVSELDYFSDSNYLIRPFGEQKYGGDLEFVRCAVDRLQPLGRFAGAAGGTELRAYSRHLVET